MKSSTHTYPGADITVTYDVARCIHAAECVRGLPAVFDPKRKPWVEPDQAPADAVAAVVLRCPSGALHIQDLDETGATEATVAVEPDGPLYIRGRLEVLSAAGEAVLTDTRVALCRCGASKNKPFCDNSHRQSGFSDAGVIGEPKLKEGEASPALRIKLAENGPLLIEGSVRIEGTDGESVAGVKCALCRCGESRNKPFCDGTHRSNGFVG
ncbi:MAG: CDGSH iron-sulfur domain-containing protein [Rhodothermales bacterium]